MRKFSRLLAVTVALLFAFATVVDAKGRTGSKRVGGYSSKGKGSHYVGGRR